MRFILVSLLFFFFSCKNGGKALTDTQAKDQVPAVQTAPVAVEDSPNNPKAVTPMDLSGVAPCSASRKAYMATGWWYCKGAVHPNDDIQAAPLVGLKIQFTQDMKMTVFRDKKPFVEGTWAFDEEKTEVYVSSTLPYLNNSFRNLEKGFRMVWLGNTGTNGSGVQMRWDNHKNLED